MDRFYPKERKRIPYNLQIKINETVKYLFMYQFLHLHAQVNSLSKPWG